VRWLEGLKAASFHPNGAVFFTIEQRSMVFTLNRSALPLATNGTQESSNLFGFALA